MPRRAHGEIFQFDPEIERTFRQRRKAQKAVSALNFSMMSENEYTSDEGENNFNFGPDGNPKNGPIPENRPIHNLEDEEQNIFRLANSKNGGIMAYAVPVLNQLHSGILKPTLETHHFELKPIMFHMLQINGQYAGLAAEDPHSHLRSFMEITDSFKLPGVQDNALKLKLFPYSLRDRARSWYNSLQPDSIITWNQMAEKFLKKYFPPTRNAKSRNEICTFKQMDNEAVPDAWDRFKELLRKCPHHGIPYCIQLETFYSGLDIAAKQMLDATASGSFTACTYNEGYEILEKISNNNGQWSDPRALPTKKSTGMPESDAISTLTTQLANMATLIQNLATPVQANATTTIPGVLPI